MGWSGPSAIRLNNSLSVAPVYIDMSLSVSAFVKQRQHFAAKERQTEVILQQDIYFRNFLENEHTMVLFWKCDHIQLSE